MASEHCPTPLSCLPRNKCAVTTARRGLTPQQCNPFYSNQAIYYIHCKYIHVTYKAENTRTYHVVDIYTADIYTARHTLHCSDPVCRALHNVQYVYCVGRWWWQSPGEEYQAFVWTCIYCILDKWKLLTLSRAEHHTVHAEARWSWLLLPIWHEPNHQNKVVAEINEMSCFQAQTREESWLDLWAGGRRWDGIS